jgi:hypothetical protein
MKATRRPVKRKSNEEEVFSKKKINKIKSKIIKFTEKRSIKKNVCRNIPEPIRPSVMATLS